MERTTIGTGALMLPDEQNHYGANESGRADMAAIALRINVWCSITVIMLMLATSVWGEVTCPPSASIEGETCGNDTNGGCFMDTPAFETVPCDVTVCGTIWADSGAHDTDWYEIVTTQDTILSWTVESECPIVIGVIETAPPGSGDCDDMTSYLDPFDTGDPNDPASIVTDCLPAGTYWLYIAHQDYYDWPCGADNDYVATLTCTGCGVPLGACCFIDGSCTPDLAEYECEALDGAWQGDGVGCDPNTCPQPEIGDNCAVPLVVNIPADLPYLDPNETTCGRVNNYEATCLESYGFGEDIIYELTVTTTTDLEITLDPKTSEWTGIALGTACPPDPNCMAISTSQEATSHGLDCLRLTPGTYYLMVDTWPLPDCIPDYDLTIQECALLGRCCYGDPVQCADVTETECLTTYSGEWTQGLNCTADPCPEVIGETCVEATVIAALPYTQLVDNDEAAADGPEGTCDKYYPTMSGLMQNDVWWVWTADSDCDAMLTVTPTGYDAVVTVQDDCNEPVELYCADDGGTGEVETVVFPATNGTTYYFQVGDTGSYEQGGLTLIELICSSGSGACCHYDGSCEVLSMPGCVNVDGQYQGDGTTCDPNTCTPFYCDASGGCEEHISNVLVGDIDNTSACDGYMDYTTLSTEMLAGSDYSITVTNGDPHNYDECGIWVDWNNDHDFDDVGETIAVSGTPGLGPYTAVVTPPLNADSGSVTLRVRIRYAGDVEPCGSTSYGEVEDYTIYVQEVLGDLNCDGSLNSLDIDPFVLALTSAPDCVDYYLQYPACDCIYADCNYDGSINSLDIDPFVAILTGG